MSNPFLHVKALRTIGVFLLYVISITAYSQNSSIWFKEYEKMELSYKFGNYHQALSQAKSLLKKINKKDELREYKLPSEALLLRYQGALGIRLESDTVLNSVLTSWNSSTIQTDSMGIMGNYTMAITCFAYNRYKLALKYLNNVDSYLSDINDPNQFWKQQVTLTRIKVDQKTMNFKYPLAYIDSVIAYQEHQVYLISNFDTLKKRKDIFKSKKKEHAREASKLGVLMVQKGSIYLEKGDVKTAREIYLQNDTILKDLVHKKDISVLLNAYGKAQVNFMLGIPSSSKELSHVRKNYADYVKYNIPNLTYFEMFEKEIQAEIRFENYNKYSKGVQQYQRESFKNYTTKSTHNFHSKYLSNISYLNNKKYKPYEKQMSKQKAVIDQFYSSTDPGQVSFLYDLALSQTYVSNYAAALKTYQTIVNIIRNSNSDTSGLYYKANLELGAFYLEYTSEYTKADSLYQKFYAPFVVEELSPYHPSYPRFLQVFAQIEAKKDFFEKALEKQLLSVKIQLDKTGNKSYEYAISLQQLSHIQIQMGLYAKAKENLKTSIQIFETFKNINPEPYINSLQDYSEILSYNGYYLKAIKRLQTAKELSSNLTLNKTTTVTNIQDHLADVYIHQENYLEAEKILLQNLKHKSNSIETNDETLIHTHSLLAEVYLNSNRTYQARKHINSAMRISKLLFGTNSLNYLQCKTLLAHWYTKLNEYTMAWNIYDNIQNAYETKFGDDYLGIAELLTNKTNISILSGNKDDSLHHQLTRATKIISKNVHEQHPEIAQIIDLKAQLYLLQDNKKQALIQYQTANLLYQSLYGNSNYKTAENLIKIGAIYDELDDFNNAALYTKKGAIIYKSLYGQNNPKHALALGKLGSIYYKNNKINDALSFLRQSIFIYNNYITNQYYKITELQRFKSWEQMKETYNLFNLIALEYSKIDPSIISEMYTNQIITKSLGHQTMLKVKKRVMETNNPQLKSDYAHWNTQKMALVQLIASPANRNRVDRLTELKSYVNYLELNLLTQTDSLLGHTVLKPTKWTSVKNQLQQTDVAIEMVRISKHGTRRDSVIYAGLILTKDSKNNPTLIVLPNGNELEGKFYNYYQNSLKNNTADRKSYSQYWEYMDAQCVNKTNIYFSGEGVYKQINPETFKPIGIPFLIDKYTFHFVSNTANLIPNKNTNDSPYTAYEITLVGNPNFGKPENALTPIPGTRKEINKLESLFKTNHWETKKYMGTKATENSIKQISNPRVLHFATHGFFMDHTPALNKQFSYYPHLIPLLKTGLYLADANALVSDTNEISYCFKDGALTALEASNLQLNNTDLVFLSACETGRSTLNDGTEISSLQQAFRIAGTKNIIMTLYKIDDKITQELVNLFYSEWLRTGNKRTALYTAKKKIGQKYNNPMYWGAFVLLEL